MKSLSKERQQSIGAKMAKEVAHFLVTFGDDRDSDEQIMQDMSYDIYSKLQAEKDEAMEDLYETKTIPRTMPSSN